MHDEEGPTDEEWTAYYSYLLLIKNKIIEARKAHYFENDTALLLNR